MITFRLYADAGLTIALNPVAAAQVRLGAPTDLLVYFGSTTPGRKLQDATAPGTNAVELAVYDSASGSGLPASAITLGLSPSELDSNTPGAALAMGVTLLSGVGNAVPVFVRFDAASAALGSYTDLELKLTAAEMDA